MRILVVVLLTLLLTSCSGGNDGLLHGAANAIPLFQPARLQQLKPVKTEWLGTNKFDTFEWVWKTTSPTVDVVAFYKKEMPAAKVTATDDGVTSFAWTSFPEAGTDEVVTVVVEKDGFFRISERLAPHKHKDRADIVKAFPPDNDVKSK
jgi:hypothetical protein